jgi:ATP-dependent Lon protease
MEVIRLSGYTEDEKVNIAERYLVPKAMKENGLKDEELAISDNALTDVIRRYTREAGVRNLERDISKICRKVVKELISHEKDGSVQVSKRNLDKYLGVPKFRYGRAEETDGVGQVTGLAWTEVGGELLSIESAAVPGKGKPLHTGSLGDVMQESIQAALTVIRSRAATLGIERDFMQKSDLHVHVPEGATPKDGPSAGIGMCTSMISALTQIPVRADVAMTGEITLRGDVLPIGGLKEKLLAAHRGGIKIVVIPHENTKDLAEIPPNIKNRLDIRPVRKIDEVLEIALTRKPQPLSDDAAAADNTGKNDPAALRAH